MSKVLVRALMYDGLDHGDCVIEVFNVAVAGARSVGWIEKDVFPKSSDPGDLAEYLGERWGQGVWVKDQTSDGSIVLLEVEPVPVTVYGLDGEGHQHLVGRAVL